MGNVEAACCGPRGSKDSAFYHLSGGGDDDDDGGGGEEIEEEVIADSYVLGRLLGSGSQGSCRLGHAVTDDPDEDQEGTAYAVKIMKKKAKMMRRSRSNKDGGSAAAGGRFGQAQGAMAREIAIMKKLDHPNLVKLVEVRPANQSLRCSPRFP